MKRGLLLLTGVLLAYLATGFYVVGGDEQAVVRRCGRALPTLRNSGLHYDGPWPFARVDRLSLTSMRTLVIGQTSTAQQLAPAELLREPLWLTGDKNFLDVQYTVQYRIRAEHLTDFLFTHRDREAWLTAAAETSFNELVTRSGIDYVQTLGLAALGQELTFALRRRAAAARSGIEIETVTLDRSSPPARVAADFLDVSNARAESARVIQDARTTAEQKQAAAAADAQALSSAARRAARDSIAEAGGAASRFNQLQAQIDRDAEQSGQNRADVRQLTLQRMALESTTDALARVGRLLVFETDQPVDLHLGAPSSKAE